MGDLLFFNEETPFDPETPSQLDPNASTSTDVSGSATQHLGAFRQALSGTLSVSGSVTQHVKGFAQTLSGTVSVSGSVAQHLGGFRQALTAELYSGGAIAQHLGGFTQVLTGTSGTSSTTASGAAPVMAIVNSRWAPHAGAQQPLRAGTYTSTPGWRGAPIKR